MRGYDHWKTTNPADQFLGPEPDEDVVEERCPHCDCGWIERDPDHIVRCWYCGGNYISLVPHVPRTLEDIDYEDEEGAADLINTRFDPPPIPPRQFDWSATFDNYEPGCPIGFGRTQAAAVQDLLEIEQ